MSQTHLEFAYMPKTIVGVLHSSFGTRQRCLELPYMPKMVGVHLHATYMPKTYIRVFHSSPRTCQKRMEFAYMSMTIRTPLELRCLFNKRTHQGGGVIINLKPNYIIYMGNT